MTGDLRVSPHPHRKINALGTKLESLGDGHGGMQAEGPGLVGTGRNDASMSRRRADDHRLSLIFGMVALLHRSEKSVEVDVEKYMLHANIMYPTELFKSMAKG